VNDHRNSRHRPGEPAWPTGADPDATKWPQHEEPQERTGFWSPLWDEEDDSGGRAPGGPARPGNGAPPPRRPVQQPTTAMRPPGRSGPPGPTGPAGPTAMLPGVRAPRDNSGDPTELLPPVGVAGRREPDLLTHREGEYDDGEGDGADLPLSEDDRRRRRKKIWRRIRRGLYVFTTLMIIGPIVAFFIAYQLVTVDSPTDIKVAQSRDVLLKYADGSDLAKIVPKDGNRTIVQYGDIPPHVLNAVFAAEDDTFMTNAGFDLTGVMRAAWNQVTGGQGGGSTISQQYIKKASGNDEKTLTRKALEVVKAYKMNRTYSKEDIITAYLNTVYFGRKAYGIAAAAKAYYGKELKALTPSEGALLAGMIQSPSRFKDDAYMQRRWNYVMDRMAANRWITDATRKTEKFPTTIPLEQTKTAGLTGDAAHIKVMVYDELQRDFNLTDDDIERGGYTIVTTLDPKAQDLAVQAVNDVMKNEPTNLAPGLVAVDPKTGQVKAYYGGTTEYDFAKALQQPGSSFKPFDLVAFLEMPNAEQGKGLQETFDSTPRIINGKDMGNASKTTCGKECPIAQAMKESLNTVFFDMAVNTTGTGKVADAAKQAGIGADLAKARQDGNISIGGGNTLVSTLDMASAYATFAANGTYRTPHLVAKVLNPDGSTYYQPQPSEKQAFDSNASKNAKIARNVTESLLPVPGYSRIPCADGRLCAGKTGTHEWNDDVKNNEKAWMVGYTPQLSTAVSMTSEPRARIINASGKAIFGSGLPGQIWKKFMDSYHKLYNLPKEDFGKFTAIGKGFAGDGGLSPSNTPSGNNNNQQPTTTTTDPNQPNPPATTTTTKGRLTKPTVPTTLPPGAPQQPVP
jgi:membrane peptidoglycan carboxypeptidase